MADAVRIAAPAKVNLRLCILAREESGFHALETVFCAISLADEVLVERSAPGIELVVEGGEDVGPLEQNLVTRAAERFYRELDQPPWVRIRLQKRIPAAAGLGGGSSDAAATLRALNALHGNPLPRATLLQLGIELGSDVPFFLCGSPLALAWSRGERLLALRPLPPRPVLIAHPGVAMPTAAAFGRIAERRGGTYRPQAFSMDWSSLTQWERLATLAANDFEGVAREQIPRVEEAIGALTDAGAQIALLSGSGAAIFGIFASEAPRSVAEERLRRLDFSAWSAETLAAEAEPRIDPMGETR